MKLIEQLNHMITDNKRYTNSCIITHIPNAYKYNGIYVVIQMLGLGQMLKYLFTTSVFKSLFEYLILLCQAVVSIKVIVLTKIKYTFCCFIWFFVIHI